MNWPSAILFDLDGTLVHSAPDIADSLNGVMAEEGLPLFTLEEVTAMVGGGVPKLLERALAARSQPAGSGKVALLASRFLEIYEPRAAEKTRLFPGAREALGGFHERGTRLGVVTNKPEAVTRRILEALGVAPLFGAVIGGDSVSAKKPDPEPVLAALEKLGASPAEAVMVGDSSADADAARAAGLPVILVTFGYTQTPAAELDCDARVDTFDNLAKVIANLDGVPLKP